MIPDYQTLMLPVLKSCLHGEVNTKDVVDTLAIEFELTAEEKVKLLPSGKQTTFSNRVFWAKGYLKQAGLVKYTTRGCFVISETGKEVLTKNVQRIDNNYLKKFPDFLEFKNRKSTKVKDNELSNSIDDSNDETTPDEALYIAYRKINTALAAELLSRVREGTPVFFEQVIVQLLEAMGYGGVEENTGHAIGGSGDDGVDGVIDQDPLGVDQIYVQAKRYAEGNNIGPGAIRDFFGALNLKNAQKGIFFTSSAFTPSAIRTAHDLSLRIVLIDGQQLAKLLIKYNIGCRDEEVMHLKKIDEEYFE